jgi:hypothetical protein
VPRRMAREVVSAAAASKTINAIVSEMFISSPR